MEWTSGKDARTGQRVTLRSLVLRREAEAALYERAMP